MYQYSNALVPMATILVQSLNKEQYKEGINIIINNMECYLSSPAI